MSNQFEPIYRLRVSEAEKYKNDGKWFQDYMNWVIPFSTTVVSNYKQMKLWYDAYQVAQTAFKGYPESKEVKLRLGGCSLILGKFEEANYHLIPTEIQNQDLDLINQLFHKADLALFNQFFSK